MWQTGVGGEEVAPRVRLCQGLKERRYQKHIESARLDFPAVMPTGAPRYSDLCWITAVLGERRFFMISIRSPCQTSDVSIKGFGMVLFLQDNSPTNTPHIGMRGPL